MSLSAIVRRKQLPRTPLIRHNSTFLSSPSPSTSSPPTPAPESKTSPTQLPPEKMRALISLYHQSKDFVSPNNLSDKIDEVFAKDFYANNTSFAGYWTLVGRMGKRRDSPVVEDPQTKELVQLQRWSASPTAGREQMVIDALYGVNEDQPGLETLLDEEERIREAAKEDEAARSSS